MTLCAATASTNAAITASLDSSLFQYRYEMDSAPNNQDLDGNLTDDWSDTSVIPVSGGFATKTADAQLFRGDSANLLWRTLNSTAAADWSLEISVAKTGGTQGSSGWFGVATANLNESNSLAFLFKDDRITVSGVDYMVGTNFADGSQHTVRIVHDSVDNAHYIWVNNTLLNANLSTPIAGTNGTAFDNSIFIGDYSSAISGNFSMDYMRFDGGAYAVPEPSMTCLLGAFGVLGLLRRRRA